MVALRMPSSHYNRDNFFFSCGCMHFFHLNMVLEGPKKVALSNRVSLVTESLVRDVVYMANIGKPTKF